MSPKSTAGAAIAAAVIVVSLLITATVVSDNRTSSASSTLRPASAAQTVTIVGAYDDVWRSVVSFFPTNGIKIEQLDKDSGIIYTEMFLSKDHSYSACQVSLFAGTLTDRRRGRVTVFVAPASSNVVTVTVLPEFTSNKSAEPCVTTGRLEYAVFQHVGAQL